MTDVEYISKLEAKIIELVGSGEAIDGHLQRVEEFHESPLYTSARSDWAVSAGQAFELIGYDPRADTTEFKGILDNVTDFHG